jgi:hypothetical protein
VTPEIRAVVVDVTALLDFGGEGAATLGAREQTHKGMPTLLAKPLGAAEYVLHAIECLMAHQRLVRAFPPRPAPEEVACVDRILQHPVGFGRRHPTIAAPMAKTHLEGSLRDGLHRVVAGRIQLEHARNERAANGIDIDAARHAVVNVPDMADAGPVSLLRFLPQPLLDLLAEVVDVVLGHQHLDAVHELVG